MLIHQRLSLLCLLCCCIACDSKSIEAGVAQISSEGSKLIEPIQESYEKPLRDIEETAQAVQATKEAVATIEKGYTKTAKTVHAVQDTISSTSASARKSVRSIAQKVPRSQKEANRMVYFEGREYLDWIKGAIQRFVDKNSLGKAMRKRRQSNQGRRHSKT